MTISFLRETASKVLQGIYPALDIFEYGRYSVDDILDQIIMELIIMDYQHNVERHSASHFRREYDLFDDSYSDDASAHRVSRLLKKVEHYKNENREELLRDAGVVKIDPARTAKDGPSNWQNSDHFTDTDFHELMMQGSCRLLFKIIEHKVSSKTSVPNPLFVELFTEYEEEIEKLYKKANEEDPLSIIASTTEYFNLQRQYNIELFYAVAEEAEKWHYPKEQYKRVKALCCLVPVIPANDIFPYEVRGAQLRMLMKRNEYVSDVFSLSDEDWAFQKDLIGEACRLTTFLIHNLAGKYFLPMIRETDNMDKAQFVKDKYWLWNQRISFELENKRKRIQAIRDLFELLTVKMPAPNENS